MQLFFVLYFVIQEITNVPLGFIKLVTGIIESLSRSEVRILENSAVLYIMVIYSLSHLTIQMTTECIPLFFFE